MDQAQPQSDAQPMEEKPSTTEGVEPKPLHTGTTTEANSLVAEIRERRELAFDLTSKAEAAARRATGYENDAENKLRMITRTADQTKSQGEDVQRVQTEVVASATAVHSARDTAVGMAGEAKGVIENIKGLHDTAREASIAVTQLREQVEGLAAESATRSQHIEEGKKHADAARASIDSAVAEVESAKEEALGYAKHASVHANEVQKQRAAVTQARENVEGLAEEVDQARLSAIENAEATKQLANKAEKIEQSLAEYEKALAEAEVAFKEQNKKIDDLLPGATSAGLAHSFEARAKGFKLPQRVWQGVFLVSVAALVLITWREVSGHGQAGVTPGYEEMLRMLIHRLPLAAPFVWLAIYSARQAALAKRLEEEYGFKAATAKSFEGFRKQMAEIQADAGFQSPLLKLSHDMLGIIGNPPGRIYEKSRPDVTPVTAAAESAPELAAAAAKMMKKG